MENNELDGYEQVQKDEGEIWKPENEGDILKGVYIQKEDEKGPKKNSRLYTIETKPGCLSLIWGAKLLDELMDKISIGTPIAIVYKGKEHPKGGNAYHKYEVWQANSTKLKQDNGETVNVEDVR